MSKGKKLWPAGPHTLAKIDIVREYLKAWLPKLATAYDEVVYFDGFSGPGKYLGGEEGSPIIALRTTLEHKSLKNFKSIRFIFVEKDPCRLAQLESTVKEFSLPDNVYVQFYEGEFAEAFSRVLAHMKGQGRRTTPTFLFIDPFGIKGIKLSDLKTFMQNDTCEFFMNYNIESIQRFCEQENLSKHLTLLYGSDSWQDCLSIKDLRERSLCLHEIFEAELSKFAKYVWRFSMYDSRNKLTYFLFFGTNSIVGLEVMKAAMWKVAPTGSFSFRARDKGQVNLFEKNPDIETLAQEIFIEFKEQQPSIDEIENFVIKGTNYKKTHTRKALKELEKEAKIQVVSHNKRRKGTFPEGTKVIFRR